MTVAGVEIFLPIISTIVYEIARDKIFDKIRPEMFIYEREAQFLKFKRESIEMAQFLAELKQHHPGNPFSFQTTTLNLFSDHEDINKIQSIEFKVWKENCQISILTYSDRDIRTVQTQVLIIFLI